MVTKHDCSLNDLLTQILETAGELFADQGFSGASIREICKRVKINKPIIYYHFKSKKHLYKTALEYAIQQENTEIQKLEMRCENLPPVKRFRVLIHDFLFHLMDPKQFSWYAQMISMEAIRSGDALKEIVNEQISPIFECFSGVIRQLAPRLSEETVKIITINVLGMIFQHYHYRVVLPKIWIEIDYSTEYLEKIVNYIANTSLTVIRHANELDRHEGVANAQFICSY